MRVLIPKAFAASCGRNESGNDSVVAIVECSEIRLPNRSARMEAIYKPFGKSNYSEHFFRTIRREKRRIAAESGEKFFFPGSVRDFPNDLFRIEISLSCFFSFSFAI